MVLIPTVAVEAVDTTAAGDAFNGGLAWALGSGLPLDAAVRQACLVGALSATRLGATVAAHRGRTAPFCRTGRPL